MKTHKSNLSLSLLYIAVFGLLVFTDAATAANDKDPTNELQTLSRTGSDVTLVPASRYFSELSCLSVSFGFLDCIFGRFVK